MDERRLSPWGWGWEDRFLDPDARAALGAQVGVLLGFEPSGPREPIPLDDLTIPPPRIPIPSPLQEFATRDPEVRLRHTYGQSWLDQWRGFRGDFSPAPDVVVFPRNEGEVARTLSWATRHGVNVVPFGGGTSAVFGVEPVRRDDEPIVTLSLAHMNGSSRPTRFPAPPVSKRAPRAP